jgi:hypothetical protein
VTCLHLTERRHSPHFLFYSTMVSVFAFLGSRSIDLLVIFLFVPIYYLHFSSNWSRGIQKRKPLPYFRITRWVTWHHLNFVSMCSSTNNAWWCRVKLGISQHHVKSQSRFWFGGHRIALCSPGWHQGNTNPLHPNWKTRKSDNYRYIRVGTPTCISSQ